MGSTMKRSIFDEQTSKALKNWTKNAKKKQKPGTTATRTLGGSPGDSPDNSPTMQYQNSEDPGQSSQQTANITASVDIHGEHISPRKNAHSGDRDLLSGP
jgi:mlo protein